MMDPHPPYRQPYGSSPATSGYGHPPPGGSPGYGLPPSAPAYSAGTPQTNATYPYPTSGPPPPRGAAAADEMEVKSMLQKKKELFFKNAAMKSAGHPPPLQQPLLRAEAPAPAYADCMDSPGEDGSDDSEAGNPDEFYANTLGTRGNAIAVPKFVESAGARRPKTLLRRLKIKRLEVNMLLQPVLLACAVSDIVIGLVIIGIANRDVHLRRCMVAFAVLFFVDLVVLRLAGHGGWERFINDAVPMLNKVHFALLILFLTIGLFVECLYYDVSPWIDYGCDDITYDDFMSGAAPRADGGALSYLDALSEQKTACAEGGAKLITLVCLRICRWLFVLADKLFLAARIGERKISECRRRYIAGGWDIDLTYITDRIVATSWPSVPSKDYFESLYRNRIVNVARFFDTMHPEHYKVYNMCAERNYDGAFFHNRVERTPIDDHQPCDIEMIHRFCLSADAYLKEDPRNVVVAHCKGGKGRTGMMICAYLVWSGEEPNWEAARERFGIMRTEENSPKVQTVESPSQNMMGKYFVSCLSWKGTGPARTCYFHSPPPKPLLAKTAVVGPMPRKACQEWKVGTLVAGLVGGTAGTVLWCSRDATFEYLDPESPCKGKKITCGPAAPPPPPGAAWKEKVLVYNNGPEAPPTEFTPPQFDNWFDNGGKRVKPFPEVFLHYDLQHTRIEGNSRFHLTKDGTTWALSKLWCWFHTSWVDPAVGHNLILPHVDGAHKPEVAKDYAEKFSMQLSFDAAPKEGGGAGEAPPAALQEGQQGPHM
eukprot:TRINITY_DN20397_c0_g1_i1.p1 TRINITY_DN20397_c0_g1~~TRINITY_DN20397_c0_g1_i1.p1  ORF type:complete len:767 (+),score=277.05 TRINITY_DN20397_c0_g1_i1:125-2425(+)